MTLTKTVEIEIDIDQIIDENELDSDSKRYEIRDSVIDYVAGLDDCEYYLISYEDEEKIVRIIAEKLGVKWEEDDEK